jgi:flagellar hook-basal body complex protein FliE
MAINTVGGAAAYAEAARRRLDIGGDDATATIKGGGPSFADMVKDMVDQTVQTGTKAEHASVAALSGKADVTDVVTAVSNAEMSLQTVVAIRDKMIQAYDDIMKMPI